jgi:hypothetical protein
MISATSTRFDAVYLLNGHERRVPVAAFGGDKAIAIALVVADQSDALVPADGADLYGKFLRVEPHVSPQDEFFSEVLETLPVMVLEVKKLVDEKHGLGNAGPAPTVSRAHHPDLGPDPFVEMTAQMCHEVNRTYARSLGDTSHAPWSSAPSDQRHSALKGVQAVLDNPTITPEQLHESWCAQKIEDGWKYGTSKDAEKRTHPCLVPYADLPEFQRTKDDLFRSVVMTAMMISGRVASPEIVEILGH